jgi:hypothetical protein
LVHGVRGYPGQISLLAQALLGWYATHGADVEAMGGNTQAEAEGAIFVAAITEVQDAEDDPYGHDLSTTLVLSHPDVVFPGGDSAWFGAYQRETLALIDVYTFE